MRRIKQNAWDNWYGYEGTRRVIAFANTPEHTAEQAANIWLATGQIPPVAPTRSILDLPREVALEPVVSTRCGRCTRFFARYRCNTPGECDCPKCQNMCTCE